VLASTRFRVGPPLSAGGVGQECAYNLSAASPGRPYAPTGSPDSPCQRASAARHKCDDTAVPPAGWGRHLHDIYWPLESEAVRENWLQWAPTAAINSSATLNGAAPPPAWHSTPRPTEVRLPASQPLSPVAARRDTQEPSGHKKCASGKSEKDLEQQLYLWARRVSNPRPLVCKTRALPLSYTPVPWQATQIRHREANFSHLLPRFASTGGFSARRRGGARGPRLGARQSASAASADVHTD
jgi:hypothetical protein